MVGEIYRKIGEKAGERCIGQKGGEPKNIFSSKTSRRRGKWEGREVRKRGKESVPAIVTTPIFLW